MHTNRSESIAAVALLSVALSACSKEIEVSMLTAADADPMCRHVREP